MDVLFFSSRNYTLVSIWHVWSGPARAAAGCFFLFLPGRVSSICVSVKQMMILHQLIRSQTRQPAKIVIPHGTPQGLGSKSMQGPGPGVYVCVCVSKKTNGDTCWLTLPDADKAANGISVASSSRSCQGENIHLICLVHPVIVCLVCPL